MNKLFWKNKKILVTGDTGFKGAWISLILAQAGAKIQGFSSSAFHDNAQFYESLKINKISNTIDGDIRDEKAIQKVFNDFQPECVFHLAAQPLGSISLTAEILFASSAASAFTRVSISRGAE